MLKADRSGRPAWRAIKVERIRADRDRAAPAAALEFRKTRRGAPAAEDAAIKTMSFDDNPLSGAIAADHEVQGLKAILVGPFYGGGSALIGRCPLRQTRNKRP